jgi:hypothetical protein
MLLNFIHIINGMNHVMHGDHYHPYDTISLISSTSIYFYFCHGCLYCKSLSCTSNLHSCDQIAFYRFNFIHATILPRFIHMTHLHCRLHPWTGFGGAQGGGCEKGFVKSPWWQTKQDRQGVCHIVALSFTLKQNILKTKEELSKLNYVKMQKFTSKNPLKETKILQAIITL